MTNLLRLELDCVLLGNLTVRQSTAAFKKMAGRHGLKVALVKEIGPAGGNPLYAFTGTRSSLLSYMRQYHNPGLKGKALDEELEYYMEAAEPA